MSSNILGTWTKLGVTKTYIAAGKKENGHIQWNKDDARQLNVKNLVWVMDENVKRFNIQLQEGMNFGKARRKRWNS